MVAMGVHDGNVIIPVLLQLKLQVFLLKSFEVMPIGD